MSAKDAQDTVLTFDGTLIGGMVKHSFINGVAREVVHRALAAPAAEALAGQPDHGTCTLTLYRDNSDPGQIKLESSRDNRLIRECVITYSDGSTRTFDAFCAVLPTAGSKDSTTPVNASACILRISGPIT